MPSCEQLFYGTPVNVYFFNLKQVNNLFINLEKYKQPGSLDLSKRWRTQSGVFIAQFK